MFNPIGNADPTRRTTQMSHLSGIEMTRVEHVVPSLVAGPLTMACERIRAVLFEPAVDVVVVELLRPQHPGQRLPHHVRGIGAERRRNDAGVERVGFLPARLENGVEGRAKGAVAMRRRGGQVAEAQAHGGGAAGGDRERILRGGFRALLRRVDRVLPAVDDELVDAVLDVRCRVRGA